MIVKIKCQNTVLRREFVVLNAYIGKEEKTDINDLNSHNKKLKI